MFEGGTPKFADVSLDDRKFIQSYYLVPKTPIYTGTTSPVLVNFDVTFDRSGGSDPRCTAATGRL